MHSGSNSSSTVLSNKKTKDKTGGGIQHKMKEAAGTLLYRQTIDGLEVLLVHPAGNYNRHSPWGIPKGEIKDSETAETAARRETFEETAVTAEALVSLGHCEYRKSRKRVHCFTGPASANITPICDLQEVDKAEFLPLRQARVLIHPDQLVFLERLEKTLKHHI